MALRLPRAVFGKKVDRLPAKGARLCYVAVPKRDPHLARNETALAPLRLAIGRRPTQNTIQWVFARLLGQDRLLSTRPFVDHRLLPFSHRGSLVAISMSLSTSFPQIDHPDRLWRANISR